MYDYLKLDKKVDSIVDTASLYIWPALTKNI